MKYISNPSRHGYGQSQRAPPCLDLTRRGSCHAKDKVKDGQKDGGTKRWPHHEERNGHVAPHRPRCRV